MTSPHRWVPEESLVFPIELSRAFVANLEGCSCGIELLCSLTRLTGPKSDPDLERMPHPTDLVERGTEPRTCKDPIGQHEGEQIHVK